MRRRKFSFASASSVAAVLLALVAVVEAPAALPNHEAGYLPWLTEPQVAEFRESGLEVDNECTACLPMSSRTWRLATLEGMPVSGYMDARSNQFEKELNKGRIGAYSIPNLNGKRVFLSFTRPDQDWANLVVRVLKAGNKDCDVFTYIKTLDGVPPPTKVIAEAFNRADIRLVIDSEAARESGGVHAEVVQAKILRASSDQAWLRNELGVGLYKFAAEMMQGSDKHLAEAIYRIALGGRGFGLTKTNIALIERAGNSQVDRVLVALAAVAPAERSSRLRWTIDRVPSNSPRIKELRDYWNEAYSLKSRPNSLKEVIFRSLDSRTDPMERPEAMDRAEEALRITHIEAPKSADIALETIMSTWSTAGANEELKLDRLRLVAALAKPTMSFSLLGAQQRLVAERAADFLTRVAMENSGNSMGHRANCYLAEARSTRYVLEPLKREWLGKYKPSGLATLKDHPGAWGGPEVIDASQPINRVRNVFTKYRNGDVRRAR